MRFSRFILLSIAVIAAWDGVVYAKDLYKVLGLKRDASDAQIKRAYRKLSVKYHPDKNPGDDVAKTRFQEIAHAYEVLSDGERRHIYDVEGEEGLERDAQNQHGPSNPLEALFGGGGRGGRRRGPDVSVNVDVTLEDLYSGSKRSVTIQRNAVCPKCRGTGAKGGKTKKCNACGGQGVRMVRRQMAPGFVMQMQEECPKCHGTGHVHKHKCPHCGGQKVLPERKTLTADIERGMPDGHKIIFERESEQQPGVIPGNVVMQLRQQPHPRFSRHGDDLHYTHHVSLREALLGFSHSLRHLDGHSVTISSSSVTHPFSVRRIAGEGMPVHDVPSQHGDLVVKFVVDFPSALSDSQKERISAVFGA